LKTLGGFRTSHKNSPEISVGTKKTNTFGLTISF
jgi:hypothetical protein